LYKKQENSDEAIFVHLKITDEEEEDPVIKNFDL
jgi:hypothetical protein